MGEILTSWLLPFEIPPNPAFPTSVCGEEGDEVSIACCDDDDDDDDESAECGREVLDEAESRLLVLLT